MKTCYFRILNHPYALAQIDLTPFSPVLPMTRETAKGNYLITRIIVPPKHRSKGIATELLSELCRDADKARATLHLEVAVYDDTDPERYIQFIKRHGFREVRLDVFERPPQ